MAMSSTSTTTTRLPQDMGQIYQYLFTHSGRHKMYPYQTRLRLGRSRFKIVNKSRQIGISSFLGCHGLVRSALEGKNVLIVSPSERQSKHVMDYVVEFWRALKEGPFPPVTIREETKHSLMFDKGMVLSLPNSASTIRGFAADDIYLDEFAHFLNGTDKEVFEAITPSVSRGGNLWLVSTPFGDNNMFSDIWRSTETDQAFEKTLIPYTACPDLDIESIRQSGAYDDASFEQEYNNQFVGEMTSEFPMSLITAIVDPELEYTNMEALQGKLCVGGYDVARDQDLSAVHVYEVLQDATQDAKEKYVLRCKWVWRGVSYQEQYMKLTAILGQGRFQWFNMDATANKDLHERLQAQYGICHGVHFTNDLKAKMVGKLKRLYEERRLAIPDDALLIRAINSIQRKHSDTNYLKYDSARTEETGHADEFWAQALALYPGDEWKMRGGALVFGALGQSKPVPSQKLIHKFLMETGGG